MLSSRKSRPRGNQKSVDPEDVVRARKFLQDYTCPMCLDPCVKPHELIRCGHFVCKLCMMQLIHDKLKDIAEATEAFYGKRLRFVEQLLYVHSTKNMEVKCPLCRAQIQGSASRPWVARDIHKAALLVAIVEGNERAEKKRYQQEYRERVRQERPLKDCYDAYKRIILVSDDKTHSTARAQWMHHVPLYPYENRGPNTALLGLRRSEGLHDEWWYQVVHGPFPWPPTPVRGGYVCVVLMGAPVDLLGPGDGQQAQAEQAGGDGQQGHEVGAAHGVMRAGAVEGVVHAGDAQGVVHAEAVNGVVQAGDAQGAAGAAGVEAPRITYQALVSGIHSFSHGL